MLYFVMPTTHTQPKKASKSETKKQRKHFLSVIIQTDSK